MENLFEDFFEEDDFRGHPDLNCVEVDPESFPAIKSWEAHEPSTQYRQVS